MLDWGRGVWTWTTGNWGSASGLHQGRRFGLQVGYGFGDTSAASENTPASSMAKRTSWREVTFHLPDGPLDGGLALYQQRRALRDDLHPIVDRHDRVAIGPFLTDQHQVFGRFAGRALLDDGTVLNIEGLTGFAEQVHNRW